MDKNSTIKSILNKVIIFHDKKKVLTIIDKNKREYLLSFY